MIACLGAVKLNKNADLDKYGCSGYRFGLDVHSYFFQLVNEIKCSYSLFLFLFLFLFFGKAQ